MFEVFFIALSVFLIPSVYLLIITGQRRSFARLKNKYDGSFSLLSSKLKIPYKNEDISLLRISNGRFSCLQICLIVPRHKKVVIGHKKSSKYFKASFWKIAPKTYETYLYFGIDESLALDLLKGPSQIFEKEFQHFTIGEEIHFNPWPRKTTALRYIGLSEEVLDAENGQLAEVFDEVLRIKNGIFYHNQN